MRTLRFLLRKEFRQIFRDRVMVFEILMVPVIQLTLLANAATFEVRNTRMYVVDDDHSATSRELIQRMAASGYFRVAGASGSMDRADEALLARDVGMILRVPPRFERNLVRAGVAPVQLVLNAEDGAAAGIARSYATRILSDYAAELGVEMRAGRAGLAAAELPAPSTGAPRIEVRTQGWFNPELDYAHYMVPGILVLLVTLIGTLLTAMNIAREKEIGTLEQLNVTPMTRGQFIAGKLIPFWIIALGELALGLLLARFAFHVPMRGSLPLVFGAAAVYLIAALGIGLWISTLVQTQQQAMFITFFIVMLYLLMSGLFTPVRSMPTWAQWLAELNPVKHFIEIMRAVLLKGAGFAAIRTPFAVLVGYAVVVFSLAVRQYSKTSG